MRTIDHGAYPPPVIAEAHPLPEPSAMEDALDVRRARALMVAELEVSAAAGDTVAPAAHVTRAVREAKLDPPCFIDQDQLQVYGEKLGPTIARRRWPSGEPAFQLDRLRDVAQVISGL